MAETEPEILIRSDRSTGVYIAFFAAFISIILPSFLPWVKYYQSQAQQWFDYHILIAGFWSIFTLFICIASLVIAILVIGDAESTSEGRGKKFLFYFSIAELLCALLFFMFDWPSYARYTSYELGLGYWISIACAVVQFIGSILIPEEALMM